MTDWLIERDEMGIPIRLWWDWDTPSPRAVRADIADVIAKITAETSGETLATLLRRLDDAYPFKEETEERFPNIDRTWIRQLWRDEVRRQIYKKPPPRVQHSPTQNQTCLPGKGFS